MNISDLEVLEVVRDEKVEGGIAFADASSNAYANGRNFAATYTSTYTNASSNPYYYYGGSSASSGSSSSSSAS